MTKNELPKIKNPMYEDQVTRSSVQNSSDISESGDQMDVTGGSGDQARKNVNGPHLHFHIHHHHPSHSSSQQMNGKIIFSQQANNSFSQQANVESNSIEPSKMTSSKAQGSKANRPEIEDA